jgi:hypothetical protein
MSPAHYSSELPEGSVSHGVRGVFPIGFVEGELAGPNPGCVVHGVVVAWLCSQVGLLPGG